MIFKLKAILPFFALMLVATSTTMRADAATVPYNDPRATGAIGLCDRANHPLHGGKISDVPFVWKAVGSSAAPALYDGVGRTATLYAFQPRPNVPADEWNGQMLTSSGRYSNPKHPMAQATDVDIPLADYLAAYHPLVDGFVQLRLYVSAPQQPLYSDHYDAADIRISGDSWSVVKGQDQDCTAGTSTSLETAVLPSADLKPSAGSPVPPTSAASATGSTASTGKPGSAANKIEAKDAPTTVNASGKAKHSVDSSLSVGGSIAVVVLAMAAVAVVVVLRRRGVLAVRRRKVPFDG